MKLSELKSHKQLLDRDLKDPAFRARWEKTALARAVGLRLVAYRAEHKLSQVQLAQRLGMKQPMVARLEAGEKNPNWETLVRLSSRLGIEFVVDITPTRRKSLIGSEINRAHVVERVTTAEGRFLVAVS
jgi:transcriptional regulator with XRE-family HTH domain